MSYYVSSLLHVVNVVKYYLLYNYFLQLPILPRDSKSFIMPLQKPRIMKSTLTKTQDGTITLTIPVPAKTVATTREEVIVDLVKNATLPGFRKGMAPRNLVEQKLDQAQLQEDVLRKILPTAYSDAVKEHDLKPVISPKIHIEKLEDASKSTGKDWEFTAVTCEIPEVTLGAYKKAIKDVTSKAKIAIPGKEQAGPNMDNLIKALLENTKITIPSILVESEVERLLSQLLDEIKSLGLSLDQYLGSTHKTIEDLKKEYSTRASNDITFEFALQKVADEEKISVEQKEIEEALAKAKSPEERANLERNIYLLASIIRQQKTLDYLKNL